MNMPGRTEVDDRIRDALAGLALGDPELLAEGIEVRAATQERSGLDPRSFALVKIAALIALDAPPAAYLWQVANALDAGVSPQDLVGVLHAIAPQVGEPRIVAAAPELMVALGLDLPEGSSPEPDFGNADDKATLNLGFRNGDDRDLYVLDLPEGPPPGPDFGNGDDDE